MIFRDEEANGEAEKQKLHSQLHSAKVRISMPGFSQLSGRKEREMVRINIDATYMYFLLQEQRSEWETKVQEAVKERAAIEVSSISCIHVRRRITSQGVSIGILALTSSRQTKLTELQSRVSRLKLSSASSSSDENPRHSQEAKTRAEERLRRIIQRCELYVQRHQMLREMGVKGRRGN